MAFEDLLKDSSFPLDNKNYFNLTITDLSISTFFPIQFRWKYEDGSFGPWSAVKSITTPGESFPNVPSNLTVVGGAGFLTVTWDGNNSTGGALTNFDRVDIYINGSPFNSSKPADSFFASGTKTITAPAGNYIVSSYAVSKAGTLSAMSTAVTRTVTSNVPTAASSVTPSTPTVSSVLGAIQLSWDGKTSTGADQPYGFNAAKVYIGTSAGFTPSLLNQVDTLNFANGQNTLNIGVGTIVNSVALAYGTDYYVKIATTNGTDTSTPVSATGNPVQIGKVTSGDIVTINADKIATGTLSSGSIITVGSTSGKHVVLSGTGDPLAIYGTGGVAGGAILSFNGAKLSIVGDGTFSGNLAIGSTSTASVFKAEPATGIWLGDQTFASAPFSVAVNGVIKANSGTIGGWTLGSTYLQGSNFEINSSNSTIYVGPTSGAHIRISASGGISTYSGGTQTGGFNLSTNGTLSLSGAITATSGSFTGAVFASSGTFNGSVTTSNISATGGTVGGWTLSSGYMYGSDTNFYPSTSPGGDANTYALITSRSIGTSRLIATSSSFDSISTAGGIVAIGSYGTNTGNYTTVSGSFLATTGTFTAGISKTILYADGRIYADTLGTSSGTPNIRQDASGYLRYTSSSSERYKNSIVDIKTVNSLDPYKLLEIPVRAFKYNSGYIPDTDQRFDTLIPGFIAEEVEEFYPIAVDYNSENKPETWVPNYMIPGMLVLIKDLSARLDALEG
jgi:hypothetical protein